MTDNCKTSEEIPPECTVLSLSFEDLLRCKIRTRGSDPIVTVYRLVSSISGMTLGAVGLFMLYSRHFRKHPYPMVAKSCIIQGIYYGVHYSIYWIGILPLNKVFAWTSGLIPLLKVAGVDYDEKVFNFIF
jgi:hypothetical protein